jgi:hypothetical protein
MRTLKPAAPTIADVELSTLLANPQHRARGNAPRFMIYAEGISIATGL